jgi:5S rRNA maturation endonuclease (ribonuclease M5)/archaellum biogenesis ATPase FlaH
MTTRSHRLSLGLRRDGKGAVVCCHAGCDYVDVLSALGMSPRDLFDDDGMRGIYAPKRDYRYPCGRVVHRKPDKSFPQSGNTKGNSLFHADRVGDAETVYWPEGEKDVEAIEAVGGVAVCSAMGAGKADLADVSPLRGKRVIVIADKDEPGRKHARQVAALLDGIAESVQIVEAAAGNDAADHILAGKTLDELVKVTVTERVTWTTLADVKPERVLWLWPGRIPVGKLVTLDGDPGLGKSTLALSFATPVTTGGSWPDGSVCEHRGAVLIMSAEDGLADTVRPRLDAAGADVTRVHAIEGVPIIDEHGERVLRPPTLADVAALEEAINRTGARLLVIDVVMAYLPDGTDSHKDQDIRRVLSRLAALADRTGCTILLLRHLNKAAGRDPLYRGGGSIAIVGAARAGLLVAPDPDDPERRVLASVKSNLGPAPESLAYRLVDAGEHGCARVQWEGQTGHTARTLLAQPSADDDGAGTEAEQWLDDYLTEQGAVSSKTAKADAAKAGIRERTLKRASQSLGVIVESRGFPRVTWWSLPSRASEASEANSTPASHQNLGPTGPTGDDLHKYSGPTGPKSRLGQHRETGPTVADVAVTAVTSEQLRLEVDGYGRSPMCPGCGMFFVANGHHSDNCTAGKPKEAA